MPFKSKKQERFMFLRHPDIAKRWVHEYGHAPAKSTARNPSKPKPRRKKADEAMPRITYAQLVHEAVAAMNEGDYAIAAELFKAALPLRLAENTEDPSAGDSMGVEACSACHRPMKGKTVYTCSGCGAKKASSTCAACSGKMAMKCSACGGSFGPSRSPVAYITAAQIRTAMPGEVDDYVDPSVGFNDYQSPTVTDPEEERKLLEEERSRKRIEELMRPGTTRYDPDSPDEPENLELLPDDDATVRSRFDLPGLADRQMAEDWRTNPDKLPAVDPEDEQRQLLLDVIKKIRDRVQPSLLNRLEEKTLEHGEPVEPYEEDGRWRARGVQRAPKTGVPGGNLGNPDEMIDYSSIVYPTADQIRTAVKMLRK